MEPAVVIGIAVYTTAFAIGSAVLAGRRYRDTLPWLVFGAILGPVAIILLLIAPPGACPRCGMRVKGWLSVCVRCGHSVRLPADEPEEVGVPQTSRPLDDWLHGMPTSQATNGANGNGSSGAGHAGPAHGQPGATTFGHRPFDSGQSAPFPPRPTADVRVLASGVYVGGSTTLEVGRRYEIARRSGLLTILGPVDSEPGKVQVERALEWMTATMVNGRLVVADESDRRRTFSLVFERIAGMTGEALEDSLRPDAPVRVG
jgi:hypothetical protein